MMLRMAFAVNNCPDAPKVQGEQNIQNHPHGFVTTLLKNSKITPSLTDQATRNLSDPGVQVLKNRKLAKKLLN